MTEKPKADQLKQHFAQKARARIPFNPLGGEDITGANVERLKDGMETFGWKDFRFVTAEQANANGWKIGTKEKNVRITTRDARDGSISELPLYNASTVRGMPSLQEMLAMSEEALMKMRGETLDVEEPVEQQAPAVLSAGPRTVATPKREQDDDEIVVGPARLPEQAKKPGLVADQQDEEQIDDEIVVGPARTPEKAAEPGRDGSQQDVQDLFLGEPVAGELDKAASQWDAPSLGDRAAAPAAETDLAVMAPYWLDGLHNHEGLKLAEQLNRMIEAEKLAKNRAAIATLVNTFPDHRRLGLEVVPRSKYLSDPHRKANLAEPDQLLGGELIRDKEGAYRPKAGGLAVLKDDGESLVLKNKSQQAYRGVMELALAKGWKAIELKGKPKMLPQAWLEAKLMGLDVVNYTPNEKDREQLAQRMAEEVKKREAAAARADAQAPEQVVVRPAIDSAGHQVTAQVTYTVDHKDTHPQQSVSPESPLGGLLPTAPFEEPAVTRTVTRVGDVVRSDVVAGALKPNEPKKASTSVLDREVSEAVEQAELDEVGLVDLEKGAKLVAHGAAPYDHNPKNKESYFVTVENESGASKTVWGIDLPRSLAEAGAKVGDTISLIEGSREPVEVEVKEPDGSTARKPAHRVNWSTTVLSRSAEIASSQAPKAETVEFASKGTHIGPIVKVEDGRIAQKAGRDPNKLIWHDISKLEGKAPGIGEMAEIKYTRGVGKVKENELEQGLSR
jgi:hypothetical protein